MSTLTIGQVLHMPPSRRSTGWNELTVTKIGRTWATLGTYGRCTLDTLLLDCGGYSPIQLYTSCEEFEQERELNKVWSDFVRSLAVGRAPAGMTLEAIKQARALLAPKKAG